jgi:hypothetical protein
MNLFQVGTTDYNEPDQTPLAQENVNSNFKAEATYAATQTGVLPLEFFSDTGCGNPPAPYDFTVSVVHALVVSLSPVGSAPNGTAIVEVHNPDGAALSGPPLVASLQISGKGVPWTTIASATPVNGIATMSYTVPSPLVGKRVRFRGVAQGPGYQTNTSHIEAITTTSAPDCIVPMYHVGEALAAVKFAIEASHCSVGRIRHRRSRRVRRGRVIALTQPSGRHLANGHRVGIVLSRGRRHR